MKIFLFAWLFLASLAFGSEVAVEENHTGKFLCRCLHEMCKGDERITRIAVDAKSDWLSIDYTDSVHSGHPTRVVDKASGYVQYHLASGARLGFGADGLIHFGLGKLWTCERTDTVALK